MNLPGAETMLVEVERMVENSPERHGALHDTLCKWIRYKRGDEGPEMTSFRFASFTRESASKEVAGNTVTDLRKLAIISPSGWETIPGLPLREAEMLDELAHGLVTAESLAWVCELVRASKRTNEPQK